MKNIREEIVPLIKNVLLYMDAYSEPALRLMLGTAASESSLLHRTQLGGGPALGVWQMEPTTAVDMVRYLIEHRRGLYLKIFGLWKPDKLDLMEQIKDNDELACALARVKYLTVPAPIPTTLAEQAAYWKKHYNTYLGAQDVRHYLDQWMTCDCEELIREAR